jgi:hypothetical protein
MRKPIFVRELTEEERQRLTQGLRSSRPFTVRRSQIILSSARGERVPRISEFLGCDDQTVRNAIVAFKAMLHRSPRDFGQETSVWTLELAAEVSFAEGITARQVSDDCVRHALKRLKVSWKRAKHWITSPDPEYERKKSLATE